MQLGLCNAAVTHSQYQPGAPTSHDNVPAVLNNQGAIKVGRLQKDGVWRESLPDRHRVGGTAHGQQV